MKHQSYNYFGEVYHFSRFRVWLKFSNLNVELIFSFKELIFIEIPFKHVLFKPRNPVSNSCYKSMSILSSGTFIRLEFLKTRNMTPVHLKTLELHPLTFWLKQEIIKTDKGFHLIWQCSSYQIVCRPRKKYLVHCTAN